MAERSRLVPLAARCFRRRVAIGLTIGLMTGGILPARSDDVEAALLRGVEFRKQGEDEKALREFMQAYEISRSPRALAQMGLAEQALGRWVDAEVHLTGALDATWDAWIQKNRGALKTSADIVATRLGSLEIFGEPSGAEVRVEGRVAGRLPVDKAVRVVAGEVLIEVRHPGYRPTSRSVNVAAGAMSRETIVLLPIATQPEAQAPTLGSQAQTLVGAPLGPTRQEAVGAASWRRPAKWVAGGLALAGLGIGVVETVVAVGKSRDFNRLPENCMDDGQGHIRGGSRCEQADHDQRVATWAASLGYVLGGAFAITAVALHLTETPTASARAVSLTCAGQILVPGVSCAARW